MNETYIDYITKYMKLSEEVVTLAEEYHNNRRLTAATELADKFYELIQLEDPKGHKIIEDM